MRYSQMFEKTSKTVATEADSINAKLLIQAGFIQPQIAGVYSYLNLGLRVLRKIENLIRQEMDQIAEEILMPVLTQENVWKQTQRQDLDILFKLKGWGSQNLVLNPTQEEIVTPLLQKYIFSYKDLPKAVYQIQTKFRKEPRAKSGLLRGREFNMKDLYSFHANQLDLDNFYNQIIPHYFNIFQQVSLGKQTILTYASGGSFSQFSHEFQVLSNSGEDTIFLCEKCQLAINKEIIHNQSSCPKCHNQNLIKYKAIEVGNIFKLGTRFSDAFAFRYQDKTGQSQPVYMGCYGIGSSRILATLAEISHDHKGLIWPKSVAPYQVHLLGLNPEDKTTQKQAEQIYQTLLKNKIEVLYDDRIEVTAGAKFNDADLIGIPWRVVVSTKTKTQVELKNRAEKNSRLVDLQSLFKQLK